MSFLIVGLLEWKSRSQVGILGLGTGHVIRLVLVISRKARVV